MSEFKFACPVCGQHITCESTASGTQMECPTCFRKLVVPQASAAGSSNLILTAAQVTSRPPSQAGGTELIARPASGRGFPFTAVALVIVLSAVAAGAYLFRDKILPLAHGKPTATKSASKKKSKPVAAPVPPPVNDTNWTLHLAGVNFPDAPAAGRINGHTFVLQRATLQGGTLSLREGSTSPLGLGVTVYLFAKQGEELAGKSVIIETNRVKFPRVTLRWKDDGKPVSQNIREGYALRIEFGQATDGRMPGKIYLCTPDDARSYVAGNFNAEIRKPQPKR